MLLPQPVPGGPPCRGVGMFRLGGVDCSDPGDLRHLGDVDGLVASQLRAASVTTLSARPRSLAAASTMIRSATPSTVMTYRAVRASSRRGDHQWARRFSIAHWCCFLGSLPPRSTYPHPPHPPDMRGVPRPSPQVRRRLRDAG